MNDLPLCLDKSKCILFADDTSVYIVGLNKKELFSTMKLELDGLVEWFQSNKLSLNLQKTNYVLFEPKGNTKVNEDSMNLIIGTITITRKTSVKFLGIYLDHNLQWTEQFKQLNIKLSRANYIMRSVRNLLPEKCKKMLYYSLFYSHLTYGNLIWGTSMPQGSINKLVKSQKKIVRSMVNANYNAHTNPIFAELKILKLTDVIDLEVLKCMFLVSKGIAPGPILDLFVPNAVHHNYPTRGRHDPMSITRKYAPLDKSYLCRGPSMWSNLHPDIKTSKTIYSLVNKIKRQKFSTY